MEIKEVTDDRRKYLSLLLSADEQESMIDRYLENGTMFVLEDGGIRGECVVTDEGGGVLEIKNIAVVPEYRGQGYGRALVEYVSDRYRDRFSILQVGTGDSPATIPFYEKCGFTRYRREKDYFTDRYDHPIFEGGVQLVDRIVLRKDI